MKAAGIYKIENLITKKVYIGSAVNMHKRFHAHRYNLKNKKHHSLKLQRSWDKYGESNFAFCPLIVCSVSNLIMYEQILINGYDSVKRGLNSNPTAGSSLGYRHSKETIEKLKKIQKSRSPETAKKIADSRRGVKMSDDARKNMKAHWDGLSDEQREQKIKKAANARIGMKRNPMSYETKRKIGAANKGKKRSEEVKLKMLGRPSHMKGKRHSEEAKKKISIGKSGKRITAKPYERTQEIKDKISAALVGRKISQHVTDKALAVRAALSFSDCPFTKSCTSEILRSRSFWRRNVIT